MDARKELLRGINYLPLNGIPGIIAVFGESAEPVLTAASEDQVIIAAAEIGRGRIVIASHSEFAANFSTNKGPSGHKGKDAHGLEKLQKNIKNWLSRGAHHHKDPVANAADIVESDLNSYRIVFWNARNARVSAKRMLDFVRDGGGFFHAVTPWGWLMANKQKSLSDIPYWDVLVASGLCYVDNYCSAPSDREGYSVKDNKAASAHLRGYLQDAVHDLDVACSSSEMMTLIEKLPSSALSGLEPLLQPLFQKCDVAIRQSPIANGKQVTGAKECGLLFIWQICLSILDLKGIKAAGIEFFPGDFESKPPVKRVDVEFRSTDTEYYFTGYCAPAGQTIRVMVNSGNSKNNWRIMIGCHTDRLSDSQLKRWPQIVTEVKLSNRDYNISSPFGGSVYFISPPGQSDHVNATLENVAESPLFRLENGEQGQLAWKTRRLSPGLWADILGQLTAITLPSSTIREIEDPSEAIKAYDELIISYHDLRGTDATKARRQWIVTDIQTCAGYMHAGYPVVTHMDVADPRSNCFLMSLDKLKKSDTGSWPIFHELGHNMQLPEWTFDGTGEVTNNIFSLFATEKFVGEKPWLCTWLANQVTPAVQYLRDGAPYKEWIKNPGVALMVYAELARDFGWDAYRKVFRRYEAMCLKNKPKENQDKIDQWYINFSEVVEFDLTPLAMFWGINLSREAVAKLHGQHLRYFLPDDEMTQAVPDRTDKVVKKHHGIVRKP